LGGKSSLFDDVCSSTGGLERYLRNTMTDETSTIGSHYEIISVRRTEPPSGVEGSNWYKYVIAFEGSNTLDGYQKGSLGAVTKAVEEFVAQLNERHMGKRGRVNLVPTPKKKN
jgi:hypothetical protein